VESLRESYELASYWFELKRRAWLIASCTILSGLMTLVATRFILTPWYRATAMLRPNSQQAVAGKLSGLAMVGGPSLGEMVTGVGEQTEAAEEYMQILRSYDFTIALVNQYNLRDVVFPNLSDSQRKPTDWSIYRRFQGRFDCEYDRLGGSLTLHFMDRDPAVARRVLGLYIKNLSDKLRQAEAHSASLAAYALKDEASHSSDVLLQTELFQLMAHQLEQEKLAQVESDFAFKIIQSPVVPDRPYKPSVPFDTLLAALTAFLLVSFGVLVHSSIASTSEVESPTPYLHKRSEVSSDRDLRLNLPGR